MRVESLAQKMLDTDAVASHFHRADCPGPRGPGAHGAQQQQAHEPGQQEAPQPGPAPAGRLDEPHQKPFFYIQPAPQQFLPVPGVQWPMPLHVPLSYSPYYGYPAPGYGMAMMPHYQSSPYMEPPAFIMPHTHLHLMDYRRLLNPQYYQTMAYHSRRFRYQHSGPNREVTSSEVQTEPLSAPPSTSTRGSFDTKASSRLSVPQPSGLSQQPSPALAVQKAECSLELKDVRTPQNGGFMIQTEEVRIECCTTPVGLQLLRSQTAEVSHQFSQDVVQCRSVVQGHVSPEEGPSPLPDRPDQVPQVCPDILLVGSSSSERLLSESEGRHEGKSPQVCAEEDTRRGQDGSFPFKVVHLPFDPKYLAELQKMESSVWSVDETLMGSPGSLILNPEFESKTAAGEPALNAGEVHPATQVPPLEEPQEVSAVLMELATLEESPHVNSNPQPEPSLQSSLILEGASPLRVDGNPKSQDTSFESLPTYLPSTSWLSDFDNLHYCRVPPTPQKQGDADNRGSLDLPNRRRKLDLEYNDLPRLRKPKERYKVKGKVDRRSLSDHECCLGRPYGGNMLDRYASKKERLCTRCLNKRRNCSKAGTGLDGQTWKRKAVPFQQSNVRLPTCEACRSHAKKRVRQGSIRSHDTEGESSENSSGLRWTSDLRDPLKRPLAPRQNLQPCPSNSNLREKSCWCSELQCPAGVWKKLRCCPHGNTIRQLDENMRSPQDGWRSVDQVHLRQRWQTAERSWKTTHNGGGFQRDRTQITNKRTTSQSHGVQRKDTRC